MDRWQKNRKQLVLLNKQHRIDLVDLHAYILLEARGWDGVSNAI